MTPNDIRALRARHNLTQTGLGDHLGVTDRSIRAWEGGAPIPPSSAAALRFLDAILIGLSGRIAIGPTLRWHLNNAINKEQ